MMKSINVTYIVAIYNIERELLEKCISSVVLNMGKDDEVLLIDDGSTEGHVAKICRNYVNERVEYIYKPNGGISSTRNTGIKLAHGKYIAFIDGDDFITRGYSAIFNQISNEEILFLNYECCENGVSTIQKPNNDISRIKILNSVLNHNEFGSYFVGVIWNKLFSKEFLLKNNLFFNEDIRKDEDGIFIVECMLADPSIKYIDFRCYSYYINPNSVCHKFNPKINQIYIDALKARTLVVEKVQASGLVAEETLEEGINRQIFIGLQGALHINAFNKNIKMSYMQRHKLAAETYREFDENFRFRKLKINHFYSKKNQMKFFMLKKKWFLLIWLYVKRTGKGL